MEEWKDVVGYEGLYMVSSMGRIKSLGNGNSRNKKWCKERLLKTGKNKDGYLQVCLWKDGVRKTCKVHRLVATAFIPNPQGLPEVNHISEIKTDNRAKNLEWCSHSYNNTYNDKSKKVGEKLCKPIFGIDKMTGLIVEYKSAKEASRQTGISQGNIGSCLKGKRKSAGGFQWFYATDYIE